jgi:hypothetical protein
MHPLWFLPLALEAGWLTALWLCVPESRPWGDPTRSGLVPGRNIVWRGHQRLLLYGYVLYHFPVLFVAWAFNLVDFHRVRPVGFLILAATTGAFYTVGCV